jgi:hypothetical protein
VALEPVTGAVRVLGNHSSQPMVEREEAHEPY